MRKILTYLGLILPLLLSAENMPRMKVGTYNIFTSDSRLKSVDGNDKVSPQRLWCNSYTAVGDMIVHMDCDIIGLQEICDSIWNGPQNIRADVAAKGLRYEWILYPNTSHGHISYDDAIGYKPDVFECLKSGIFWMAGVFNEPKMADDAPKGSMRPTVWAHMKHKTSGKEFYFLSTHLLVSQKQADGKYNHDGNKYNAKQIRTWCLENLPDEMPAILVGDMNVDDKAKHWGSLAQAPFMDAKLYFLHANRLSADAKAWGTQDTKDESEYSKWWPDHIMFNGFRPLDYVIYRDKFPTVDGSLHYPSDHLPVSCMMEFRDYSPSGLDAPEKGKKALRAMSFNVRYRNNNVDYENGWDHRKRAIPAMLEDVKPDVFGTQEITKDQIEYLDVRAPQYKHVGVFREGGDSGECPSIYYNDASVSLQDWGAFWLSETPSAPSIGWDGMYKRTAVWARIKARNSGKEFFFVTTHLDHKGQQAREKGLNLILDTLKVLNPKNLPCILVGDLNSLLDNPALVRISKEMKNAQETAASTDSRYTFNGFGKSWTGTIDYIWYKGPRKCTQFQVVSRKYMHIPYISDHYPIWADFEL